MQCVYVYIYTRMQSRRVYTYMLYIFYIIHIGAPGPAAGVIALTRRCGTKLRLMLGPLLYCRARELPLSRAATPIDQRCCCCCCFFAALCSVLALWTALLAFPPHEKERCFTMCLRGHQAWWGDELRRGLKISLWTNGFCKYFSKEY